MEKVLNQIQNIGREIYQYTLPGSMVSLNFVIILIFNPTEYSLSLFNNAFLWFTFFIIISSFFGHIIHAIMYVFIEIPFIKDDDTLEKEVNIFLDIKKRDAYEYFIERYNQLEYFRWNLSGAFFLIFFINLVTVYGFSFHYPLNTGCLGKFVIFVLPFLIGFLMTILSNKTMSEKKNRITKIFNLALKQ
jgi:hypothetical protein